MNAARSFLASGYEFAHTVAGWLAVLALAWMLAACLDVTVRVEVPCSAAVIRHDTTAADTSGIGRDTILTFWADTVPCPRSAP